MGIEQTLSGINQSNKTRFYYIVQTRGVVVEELWASEQGYT